MDLIDEPRQGRNLPEYTVSEISGEVKRTLEGRFGRVRVRGEVSRVFKARSGHLYYDIKDENAVLSCTTWRGQIAGLSVMPEEGLEVVVTGRLTTFAQQSKYNLNVDDIRIAGQGALMALLEKRRKALEAEGLFAPERKRPLPFLPRVIGVVTSPQGAVIRDILHRLRDRFPRHVLVWPVAVQGESCAREVASAIEGFNRLPEGGPIPRPDLIIVARGGGSIEDLWGFNEEVVVRAAAASEIPLISAVGHETDWTLIDHAADWRAPTPTAAAEKAVPVRLELLAAVEELGGRLARAMADRLERRAQRVSDLGRILPQPERLLEAPRQRLDYAGERLPRALSALVERHRGRLSRLEGMLRPALLAGRVRDEGRHLARLAGRLTAQPIGRRIAEARRELARLWQRAEAAAARTLAMRAERLAALARLVETLSYRATLERGYAVVRHGREIVTRAEEARRHAALEVEFADGKVPVRVAGRRGDGGPKTPPGADGPRQDSLF